jgi:hypothetical protein
MPDDLRTLNPESVAGGHHGFRAERNELSAGRHDAEGSEKQEGYRGILEKVFHNQF